MKHIKDGNEKENKKLIKNIFIIWEINERKYFKNTF